MFSEPVSRLAIDNPSTPHSNVRVYLINLRDMASTSEVLPGDSVSQDGGESSFDSVISKCVVSPQDYIRMWEISGEHGVGKLMADMRMQLLEASRCAGRTGAALRVASAGSSLASSSVSSGSGCSTGGSKTGKLLSGASRRLSARKSNRVPHGLCYSKLLRDDTYDSIVAKLGEWPTVSSLLSSPFSSFQSLNSLERFRLVGTSSSVHVWAGGSQGDSLLDSLSSVARAKPPVGGFIQGTLGAVLSVAGLCGETTIPLTLSSKVGGDFKFNQGFDMSQITSGPVSIDVDGTGWMVSQHAFVVKIDTVASVKFLMGLSDWQYDFAQVYSTDQCKYALLSFSQPNQFDSVKFEAGGLRGLLSICACRVDLLGFRELELVCDLREFLYLHVPRLGLSVSTSLSQGAVSALRRFSSGSKSVADVVPDFGAVSSGFVLNLDTSAAALSLKALPLQYHPFVRVVSFESSVSIAIIASVDVSVLVFISFWLSSHSLSKFSFVSDLHSLRFPSVRQVYSLIDGYSELLKV